MGGGPSEGTRWVSFSFLKSRKSWGNRPEVRDGSEDPPGRPWTGQETLSEVGDGSGDPLIGPGLVRGPSQGSGTSGDILRKIRDGWDVLRKVWNGLGNPPGGQARARSSRRYGMG